MGRHGLTEHFDTDSLRSAGSQFSAHSQALLRAHQRLRASLPDAGAMGGDDEPGRRFSTMYRPNARELDQFLDDMTTGLDSGGGRLRAMAVNLEEADDV